MAKGKKGGSYEMVLEGRHVLGIFFAVVVVCALFFTLGFVLGRGQAGAQKAAAAPTEQTPAAAEPASQPAPEDLSFYDRVERKQTPERAPAATSQAAPSEVKPKVAAPAAASPAAPAIYLQVAALTQEPDAKRLAAELQKLGFPPVIRPPREDRFYRILVGPFENDELAVAAKQRLEANGFKGILKR